MIESKFDQMWSVMTNFPSESYFLNLSKSIARRSLASFKERKESKTQSVHNC